VAEVKDDDMSSLKPVFLTKKQREELALKRNEELRAEEARRIETQRRERMMALAPPPPQVCQTKCIMINKMYNDKKPSQT
jgi:hypothetical protein